MRLISHPALFILVSLCAACGSQQPPPAPAEDADAVRTRECNQIVEIINHSAEAIDQLGDGGTASNRSQLDGMASALERATQDIARVTLTVPALQQRAGQYQQMAKRSSAAARELSAALNTQDETTIQRASLALQAAVEPEDQVIESINALCLGR